MNKCISRTKAGTQCSRNAKKDNYCTQHSNITENKCNLTSCTNNGVSTISVQSKVDNIDTTPILGIVLNNTIISESHIQIYKSISLDSNFSTLQISDLETLFRLYDSIFFNFKISQLLAQKKHTLTFKLSTTLTKTAGRLKSKGCNHILEISVPVLNSTFIANEKCLKINGIKVYNRLEVLCNLFEHELTHLIVALIKPSHKDCDYSSHGKCFYGIVSGYFGHTACRHDLLAGDAEIKEQKTVDIKEKLKIDDTITFNDRNGVKITAIIKRINIKTVTAHANQIKYKIPFSLI
jgi:hypothetical protein